MYGENIDVLPSSRKRKHIDLHVNKTTQTVNSSIHAESNSTQTNESNIKHGKRKRFTDLDERQQRRFASELEVGFDDVIKKD